MRNQDSKVKIMHERSIKSLEIGVLNEQLDDKITV